MTRLQVYAEGEKDELCKVVYSLRDDDLKLSYADWLDRIDLGRATFLRRYVKALGTMRLQDFPQHEGFAKDWLDMIGFNLMVEVARTGFLELKTPVLTYARPAVLYDCIEIEQEVVPPGVSRFGGDPDLPADFIWPCGRDCTSIYNDGPGDADDPAGFIQQINLRDLSDTIVGKELPKEGLISLFCYQRRESLDETGIKTILFDRPGELRKATPPQPPSMGNRPFDPVGYVFWDALDIPTVSFDGPWSSEMYPDPDKDYYSFYDKFRHSHWDNFFGYGRETTNGDPASSKDSRNLTVFSNDADCRFHVQILDADRLAGRFDKAMIGYVDFD